jgi:hypothetical protein
LLVSMEIAPVTIIGKEHDGEGFTPVRRRLSTINTRQLQSDAEVEWTATRCNRLLRALTSRVAILKKDLARHQANTTTRIQIPQEIIGRGQKRSSDNDLDWTQNKKRVRRTYTGRGGGDGKCANPQPYQGKYYVKEGRSLIPGEIPVPTPALRRARSGVSESQSPTVAVLCQKKRQQTNIGAGKRPKTKQTEEHLRLSEMMRGMKKKMAASRYTTYEGIYNGLETLLKATTPGEPIIPRKGSRSLLSMCLVAVPRYIAREEALLDAQLEETRERSAINNRDISTEIYDDLEAFGSFGRGWKHFRIIVRSHGIQVVNEAILDGLLVVEFCGILVALCNHMGAAEEAETLLSAILAVGNIPAPNNVFSRFVEEEHCRPLSLLWTQVEQRHCHSFQHRELAKMFSNDRLPLTWVATKEFGSLWTKVIQTLSSDHANEDAVCFLERVLSGLATMLEEGDRAMRNSEERKSALFEAARQTYSSLLTTLVSIVILGKETATQREDHASDVGGPKYETILVLLRGCVIQRKLSARTHSHGTLLLLANLVLGNLGNDSDLSNLDILLNRLRDDDSLSCNDIVALVCSIARCCGMGTFNSGFEHLEDLHILLQGFADGREPKDVKLLYRIIVDSAFTFAQHTPERKHLEYATSIQGKFQVMKTKPNCIFTLGNDRGNEMLGYRWEEGISEWVTATPNINRGKEYDATPPSSSESKYGTPFRSPLRRNVGKEAEITQKTLQLMSSFERNGADATPSKMVNDSPACYSDSDISDDAASERIISMSTSPFTASDWGSQAGEELMDSICQDGSISPAGIESGPEELTSLDQEESLLDNTFTSNESSVLSCSRTSSAGRRQYVDRVPRLSRRILRNSLQWKLFEESDDELSFHSTSSSQGREILRNITNTKVSNKQPARKGYPVKRQKPLKTLDTSPLDDSEDELCI